MAHISEFVGIDVGKDEFFAFSIQHGDLGRFANTGIGIERFILNLVAPDYRP